MKSRLINVLFGFLLIAALSSCAGMSIGEKTNAGFVNTYSSQFLTGDVYILKDHEKIDGNIAGIGTTLIIEEGAIVMGDISLVASSLEVNGRVAGDINLFAGTSTINDTAIVTGSINQIINQTTTLPKALIGGEINTYVFPSSGESNLGKGLLNIMEWIKPSYWLTLQTTLLLALIIVTVLSVFLFNIPTRRVVIAIQKNLAVSWGAGILTQFFIPVIALVLILTICLSPIGIIAALALVISIIWGWSAICLIVGERFTLWLKLDWSNEATAVVGAVLTGVIISAISLVPCIGFLFNMLIAAVGLGGVLLSRFGTSEI